VEMLEKFDRELFLTLNGFHTTFLDYTFWIGSLVLTWIPLYIFFFILALKKFKNKSWIPLLGAALLILATDKTSVLIKNSVKRVRPTHNIEIQEKVHVLFMDKGGQFGFVSSHAANMWGLATYMILLMNFRKRYFSFLLLFWAAFVSYGRIYAGVHYPADVAGGALLGILLAFVIFKLQNLLLIRTSTGNPNENVHSTAL
jgi:undecaprenyl-diphosphatase